VNDIDSALKTILQDNDDIHVGSALGDDSLPWRAAAGLVILPLALHLGGLRAAARLAEFF
jgi:hypothetical protein